MTADRVSGAKSEIACRLSLPLYKPAAALQHVYQEAPFFFTALMALAVMYALVPMSSQHSFAIIISTLAAICARCPTSYSCGGWQVDRAENTVGTSRLLAEEVVIMNQCAHPNVLPLSCVGVHAC